MQSEKTSILTGILRKNAYKLTSQRLAVLEVITNTHDHLTPQEIFKRVRKAHPFIGLVTVYRTIEVLEELNLVCRVHAEDNCRSYLIRRPSGHHHHVVCTSCGKTMDFTWCNLDKLERRLSQETGFQVEGHLLEFNGKCRACVGRKNILKEKQAK